MLVVRLVVELWELERCLREFSTLLRRKQNGKVANYIQRGAAGGAVRDLQKIQGVLSSNESRVTHAAQAEDIKLRGKPSAL